MLGEHRKIEWESGISPESVLSMRWIKPLARRSTCQCTEHLIARICTTEAVNLIIRDGLIIAGKGVWAS